MTASIFSSEDLRPRQKKQNCDVLTILLPFNGFFFFFKKLFYFWHLVSTLSLIFKPQIVTERAFFEYWFPFYFQMAQCLIITGFSFPSLYRYVRLSLHALDYLELCVFSLCSVFYFLLIRFQILRSYTVHRTGLLRCTHIAQLTGCRVSRHGRSAK